MIRALLVAIVAGGAMSLPLSLHAQQSGDIAADRQHTLESMLKQFKPVDILIQRQACATGKEPQDVEKLRAKGISSTPDATDTCVAMLRRSADDGTLLYLYPLILKGETAANFDFSKIGPRDKLQAKWTPVVQSMVSTASKGGKILPALAFDAGFANAYLGKMDVNTVLALAPDSLKDASGGADTEKLRLALADILATQVNAGGYPSDLVTRAALVGQIYGSLYFKEKARGQ